MRILAMVLGLMGLSAVSVPAASFAQDAPPPVKLKSGKPYIHPHTKLVIPEILGGMKRSGGKAYFADDLNTAIQYELSNASEAITVFIFRNTSGNIPIWFDRARENIEKRGAFGNVKSLSGPVSFSVTPQGQASAMRVTYALLQSNYKSSALALVPVGEFYIKIRASSSSKTPQETDALMDKIIKDITWPTQKNPLPAAIPVKSCETAAKFETGANKVKQETANALIGGLLSAMPAAATDDDAEKSSPKIWCRDSYEMYPSGVYRLNNDANSYMLALSDAGAAIYVGPDADDLFTASKPEENVKKEAQDAKAKTYSVTLKFPDSAWTYASRDRLLPPSQTMEIINSENPTSKAFNWGKRKGNIEISAESIK